MAKNPPNLWLRYRTWFLRLSIPPSLRHHFGGKEKIVESLGTDSLGEAIVERDRRVAEYHARFERLRTGGPPTADEVVAAIKRVIPSEPRKRKTYSPEERAFLDQLLVRTIERQCADEIQATAKTLGITIEHGSPLWRDIGTKIIKARMDAGKPATLFSWSEDDDEAQPAPAAAPVINGGEKFSEAFAAHVRELERAGTRATTIASYRQMAGVFQAWCKDAPLASITRARASDFLVDLGTTRGNATVNQYAALLAAVFETARKRGRLTGDNPFADQKRRAEVQSYEAFTGAELTKLFASVAFEMRPKTHTVATALPWVALIAAYSGLRREEVAQLRVQDLREVEGVWVLDVTKEAGPLKNKGSARIVPVHSALLGWALEVSRQLAAGRPSISRSESPRQQGRQARRVARRRIQ
jgi:integrase